MYSLFITALVHRLQVDHIFFLEKIMTIDGAIRFYLTRPEINAMNIIVDHIKSNLKAKKKCSYHIIFIPRILASCEYVLEREGIIGQVNILNWNLNLIPLDEHVLSLEYKAITTRSISISVFSHFFASPNAASHQVNRIQLSALWMSSGCTSGSSSSSIGLAPN